MSMDQQRTASPLDADNVPDRAWVAIPKCAIGPEGSCPFSLFQQLVADATDYRCVHTTKVHSTKDPHAF